MTGPGGNTYTGGKGGAVVIGPNGNVHATGGKAGSVTTPGGKSIAGGSHGQVTVGPNGASASGGRGVVASGPGGTVAAGGRGGVAAGPNGVVAGGSRGAVATGPGGTVAAGGRGAVAAGPGGTIAAGGRGAIASGPYGTVAAGGRAVAGAGYRGYGAYGTRYVGGSTLRYQGGYVRQNFGYYNAFRPGWYANYPGAWFAAGWLTSSVWNAMTWGSCSSYCGYSDSTSPMYYDYGNNVTYDDGNVYYDGQQQATEAEYAQQASDIADVGQQAEVSKDDDWSPLGVFAMTQGDAKTSDDIFQLGLNKDGIVRGNYYNAKTDEVQQVAGSLDKDTQRVAWTIGDQKQPVYETGLYNLTQEETTLLAHFGDDKTQQYNLYRIPPQDENDPNAPPTPGID